MNPESATEPVHKYTGHDAIVLMLLQFAIAAPLILGIIWLNHVIFSGH